MELRHLRYFVAAAEAENVSRAALRLHVSQPALSRQIRDLEYELGFALFERTARSVQLTAAGKSFLGEARAVLARVELAVKTARAIAVGGGELHVGYAPSPTVRLLPPALRRFQSEMPNVRVKLHDLSTEEMLSGLRQGSLQICFVVRPSRAMLRGLEFEELARDVMCLAVPPQHRFARQKVIAREEAAREPLVGFNRKDYPEYHEYIDDLFSRVEGRPRIVEEHDSATSLIAAVEAGAGVAIVPQGLACSAGARLKLVRLSPAPEEIVIGAVWPAAGVTPAAERFLQCARGRLGGGAAFKG